MDTEIVDMTAHECRERLAAGGVGRVAWCAPDGPRVLPVNFTVVEGDIVFRTAAYTELGRHLPGQPVAFEVDDLDHDRRAGWSVLVRGDAAVVDEPEEVAALRGVTAEPWAPGQRRLFLRVRPRTVTGRRVAAG